MHAVESRLSKSTVVHKVDKQTASNDFAFCITNPKSDDFIDDNSFDAIHAYPLIERGQVAMDSISYCTLQNKYGEEVTRKSCFFVEVFPNGINNRKRH
jgi:hypothetical protein